MLDSNRAFPLLRQTAATCNIIGIRIRETVSGAEHLPLLVETAALTSGVARDSSETAIVAVVDDDHRVLEALEEFLESAGYAAQVYLSAMEFLDSGALSAIRCLISDVRMPVVDGWELEAIVSRARPDLPVILITGDDVAQREAQSRPDGRPRILFKKPFDAQDLLAAIRGAVKV